jgi:hypothetical protein
MTSRRDFFKQFIAQSLLIRDEIRGHENIPLKRLKELPDNIIEGIIPVFFLDTKWELNGKVICVFNMKNKISNQIDLTEIEDNALACFKRGLSLKQTAIEINEKLNISLEIVYKSVTSFFFVLANLQICHPREVYKIDEIISSNQKAEK